MIYLVFSFCFMDYLFRADEIIGFLTIQKIDFCHDLNIMFVFSFNGNFDNSWQRNGGFTSPSPQQLPPTQRSSNYFNSPTNNTPHSPLLSSNGDPWSVPTGTQSPRQQLPQAQQQTVR